MMSFYGHCTNNNKINEMILCTEWSDISKSQMM